ncbi:hypothetical protein [Curtobacterium sp. NPDC089689]|uniref:hypothetical protein n=1 Tax=Curtobacterium sp. NPDC089689 TaxID=3363968 RepID=UPI00380F3CFA
MHPLRRHSVSALVIGVVGASVLVGCSGGDHREALSEDSAQWMSLASAQLGVDGAANHGGGGGGLIAEDGGRTARALVSLEYDLHGPYDVLAVRRSKETVHLRITELTVDDDGPSALLGQADITCGTSSRIPIDVPAGSDGITLDASTTDRSGRSLFDALDVTRGAGR